MRTNARLDVTLGVRLTAAEAEAVREIAAADQRPVASLLRLIVRRALADREGDPEGKAA